MQHFTIQIPDEQIDDLKKRLANTRWFNRQSSSNWEKGVPEEYLRKLAAYWSGHFDWRRQEKLLNSYPQFITQIDGQNIHFVHIRSSRAGATPLLLIHGWPGSFADFINIIEPLTNPASGDQISFDLVIPSIPGFGFSIPVKGEGWNMLRIANAFTTLMNGLGYGQFAVHGGDMGAGIAGIMSIIAADKLIGTHINSDFYALAGLGMFSNDQSSFTDEENNRMERMKQYKMDGTAYLAIQSTRPYTIGIALTDSPVAQLAWIVEKYKEWTDAQHNLPEDAIDIDHMLTNVSLYWFNQLGASSAAILSENMNMAFNWSGENSGESTEWKVPKVSTAIACFGKKEDRSLMKKLVSFMGEPDRFSFYEKGCHFPAMEVPDLLVNDIRIFYQSIIK